MSEKKISYLKRNYQEYREAIINIARQYYPDVFENMNDSSVGAWLVDVFADIADNLSYHIDRTYQETAIGSAQQTGSLMSLARTQGLRIPGPKSAIVEVELSCTIPKVGNDDLSQGDTAYLPVIKRGTLFSTGLVMFELIEDVDFSEQSNMDGLSNRQIIPARDSNGNITGYVYKKLAIARAGQSKVYKKVISADNIKPFMNVILQDSNILGVEGIIFKQGTNLNCDPAVQEFYVDEENTGDETQHYFEVENLIDQYRFGVKMNDNKPVIEDIKVGDTTVRQVVKGEWKFVKNKYVTEFTDNWSLKVTFGAGINDGISGPIPEDASEFTKHMMSRMLANNYMGVLPSPGTTMFILYRVGGGAMSNIAKGSLTNITYLNVEIGGTNSVTQKNVYDSITVTNTCPSYGGKDAPSDVEIRNLLKYHTSAQNRCVTLNDYKARITELPEKYGTPFRVAAVEENNKIVLYFLGLNSDGTLSSQLSDAVANNIKEYLKNYRMINDFIEMRSGYVMNIGFEIDVFVDKSYDKSEVAKRIIDLTYDYMDIKNHMMGEDIFLGDLEKDISLLDGVINLIELRCYDLYSEDGDNGYTTTPVTQALINNDCDPDYLENDGTNVREIDLKASDKILFAEENSMFEIKRKNLDIKVNIKVR